jgi:hypothetical protein
MKYVTLRIQTEERGTLYEKDVPVRNAFEAFIRNGVTSLVQEGTIHAGEHYSAIVTPRYANYFRPAPLVTVDPDRAAEASDWIEMRFDDPVQPDAPVRFFTVELRVRETNLIYRRDFQTLEVGRFYVGYGIEQALIGLGLLRPGDYYSPCFLARDDDLAQFDRERIPALEETASSLVELAPDEPLPHVFPPRDPATYGEVEVVGEVSEDDVCVYVKRDTIERIAAEARGSADVERGGILVGDVYENTTGGRRIVEINDFIVSEHTAASVTELRTSFETWKTQTALMRERFPDRRVVGWFHTHLVEIEVYTDDARDKTEATPLFFSQDDVFMHKQFFPEEWYVALVLDLQGSGLFFQWKNADIVCCGGYRVFEGMNIAG